MCGCTLCIHIHIVRMNIQYQIMLQWNVKWNTRITQFMIMKQFFRSLGSCGAFSRIASVSSCVCPNAAYLWITGRRYWKKMKFRLWVGVFGRVTEWERERMASWPCDFAWGAQDWVQLGISSLQMSHLNTDVRSEWNVSWWIFNVLAIEKCDIITKVWRFWKMFEHTPDILAHKYRIEPKISVRPMRQRTLEQIDSSEAHVCLTPKANISQVTQQHWRSTWHRIRPVDHSNAPHAAIHFSHDSSLLICCIYWSEFYWLVPIECVHKSLRRRMKKWCSRSMRSLNNEFVFQYIIYGWYEKKFSRNGWPCQEPILR